MAKGKLFEYALLYHPKQTKEQLDLGEQPKSELLAPPVSLLAGTEAEVGVVAARAIPEKYLDKLDDVEIVIRPF